jgi:hypothetical protein
MPALLLAPAAIAIAPAAGPLGAAEQEAEADAYPHVLLVQWRRGRKVVIQDDAS